MQDTLAFFCFVLFSHRNPVFPDTKNFWLIIAVSQNKTRFLKITIVIVLRSHQFDQGFMKMKFCYSTGPRVYTFETAASPDGHGSAGCQLGAQIGL